jgi:Flp pilus assembly protein TadG
MPGRYPNKSAKTRHKNFLRSTTGSEIAEAALVLPLAFMMLLGIYWFGRAFNIYATINQAAQQGARVGAAQTCATCGNTSLLATQGATVITNVMQASHVNPGQIQAYTPALNFCTGTAGSNCSSATNNIRVCSNVQITPNATPGPPVCGVAVTFQYPYQSWLPFTSLNMQQIILRVNVQMKGEY